MTPRKKKKKKISLLTRLIKGGKGKGKKASTNGRSGKGNGAPKAEAKPLSPLERSIQEIKHLSKVGSRDPERLAMILSAMLGVEQEKTRQDQEKFDSMVQDIIEREDGKKNSDSEEGEAR